LIGRCALVGSEGAALWALVVRRFGEMHRIDTHYAQR